MIEENLFMKHLELVESSLSDRLSSVSGIKKLVENKIKKKKSESRGVNWHSINYCLIELKDQGKAERVLTEQGKALWKRI